MTVQTKPMPLKRVGAKASKASDGTFATASRGRSEADRLEKALSATLRKHGEALKRLAKA